MNATARLAAYLNTHHPIIGKVVDYDAANDKVYPLNFTASNSELNANLIGNTEAFSQWINQQLHYSRYGIGGYMEHRTVYARSALFDLGDEPRRLHLGIDIWAKAGTPVYSPLPGIIHSFNDNDNFGDYGPTIIITHQLQGLTLHSLYGHLSRASLAGLQAGQNIGINQQIGSFGEMHENGQWPPHLHFQLMFDMQGFKGDYLGVGQYSKMQEYAQNIPDPNLLLRFPGI